MLPAKALIARRSRGAACSPGLATGMFTAAPLDIIRVIPTQLFKGILQGQETTCREPFATMIVAAVSKLPDQIFHNPSKISHLSPLHSVRVLLDPEEHPAGIARAPSRCNCRNEEKLWRRDQNSRHPSASFQSRPIESSVGGSLLAVLTANKFVPAVTSPRSCPRHVYRDRRGKWSFSTVSLISSQCRGGSYGSGLTKL